MGGLGGRGISQQDIIAALRASDIGIWSWDAIAEVVHWSPVIEHMVGLQAGAFGSTFEAYAGLVHPDDRPALDQALAEIQANPLQDYRVEHRLRRIDGSYVWIEGRGRARVADDGTFAGMLGTATDVTARKTAEEETRASELRLLRFSELVSDYMYVVDMKAPSLAPNVVAGSIERTTGYTPEQIAAEGGWLELMHPDDKGNVEDVMHALERGQPVVNEYRITTRSGGVRWLRDRMRPVLEDGQLVQLVGGVQDITDRKNLEDRLADSQKMEALARLAGGVAHDFNNLLTILFTSATVLERTGELGERAEGAIADIRHVTDRAAELTHSLLAFGRKQVTSADAVSLRGLVAEALPMFQRAVGERVQLLVDVASTKLVWADSGQIELALLNLCLNARDAMPEGGTISIAVRDIELTAGDEKRPADVEPGTWVVTEIRDTGEGVPPEDLPRIFEPFFSTKETGRGTGLGLATVYGIVRGAGGTIDVHSEKGVGTVFSIFLPPTDKRPVARSGPARHAIGGHEHILLVEDEPLVRKLTERTLNDLGYHVIVVSSAEEALALDASVLAGVELLLSDVRLPGKPGTELAETMASRYPNLRILLVSGYIEDAKQQMAVESGRYSFLAKPYSPDGLARRIREVLEGDNVE